MYAVSYYPNMVFKNTRKYKTEKMALIQIYKRFKSGFVGFCDLHELKTESTCQFKSHEPISQLEKIIESL